MIMILKSSQPFISYLDRNNLYGWAMSEYLPCKDSNWLKNIDEFNVMSITKKSPIRYLVEVDLKYSAELHELHNDCPLAPKTLAVSSDMFSKYCKKNAEKYDMKVGDVKN